MLLHNFFVKCFRTIPHCPESLPILYPRKKIHPKSTVVHQIPSINYTRERRSVLLCITKNMPAFELAKILTWNFFFTDGTIRWQVAIQNVIIDLPEENGEGFKSIMM